MSNVHDVANSFLLLDKLNDGEGISHLKLQKLVYYAQGFYLAIFDRAMKKYLMAEVEKMENSFYENISNGVQGLRE